MVKFIREFDGMFATVNKNIIGHLVEPCNASPGKHHSVWIEKGCIAGLFNVNQKVVFKTDTVCTAANTGISTLIITLRDPGGSSDVMNDIMVHYAIMSANFDIYSAQCSRYAGKYIGGYATILTGKVISCGE